MSEFATEIVAHGMTPPNHIEPGRLHRFPGINKKRGNKAGWCRLFPDGKGGVFGDWSTGFQSTWQDSDATRDNAEWQRQMREAQRLAKAARRREQKTVAEKAARLWGVAWAADSHPYLTHKQIEAHGTRCDKHANLLVPVTDGERITSLQFIKPDGTKLFLSGGKVKGCWYRIGDLSDRVLICEGFATGATLHQESGGTVFCAFNAGNLVEVARMVRERMPDADMVICGDNDHATAGNPGRVAARKAAQATGVRWTVPDFTGLDAGPKDTDFNDLARLIAKRGAL